MVAKKSAKKTSKPTVKKAAVKDLGAGPKAGKVKGGLSKPDTQPSVKCTD